jgi:Ca2+/Na+ antiporter
MVLNTLIWNIRNFVLIQMYLSNYFKAQQCSFSFYLVRTVCSWIAFTSNSKSEKNNKSLIALLLSFLFVWVPGGKAVVYWLCCCCLYFSYLELKQKEKTTTTQSINNSFLTRNSNKQKRQQLFIDCVVVVFSFCLSSW